MQSVITSYSIHYTKLYESQRPIVQKWQIEAGSVPGYELGLVFLETVEKSLNDFRLRVSTIAETENVQLVPRPKNGRNYEHAVLGQGQKLSVTRLFLLKKLV